MLVDTYRRDVFRGKHSENHQYRLAVYTGTLDPAKVRAYSPEGEAVGQGYPPGGVPLTGFRAELNGRVATLDFDNPILDPVTLAGRSILIYNASLPGKDAVYVGDLGREIVAVNGPWTPGLPRAGAGTSLIQW